MPEKMKCPFQRGEHGEFLDCFGAECMAHYEYTPFLYLTPEVPPSAVPMCRMMDRHLQAPPSFPVTAPNYNL